MKLSGLKKSNHYLMASTEKTAQQKAFPASADGEDEKSLL